MLDEFNPCWLKGVYVNMVYIQEKWHCYKYK